MKLIIHAGLFAMGTLEYDTESHQAKFLIEPLINADQSVTTMDKEPMQQLDALNGGTVSLAVINQAVAMWILKRAGIDAVVKRPEPAEPIPLTNVLGGKGDASA